MKKTKVTGFLVKYVALLSIAFALALVVYGNKTPINPTNADTGEEIPSLIVYEDSTSRQLLEKIEKGEVVSVISNNVNLRYSDGKKYYQILNYDKSLDDVIALNELNKTPLVVNSSSGTSLFSFILTILFYGLIFTYARKMYMNYRTNTSLTKESKTDDPIVMESIPKVSFNDVSGCNELKKNVYNDIQCLKNPALLEEMGARLPKGLVLYGPPGTGKTMIAKAIANEAGVPFIYASGSDFMEMYVGVGAKRIRELYQKARKVAPCIVFIDEIDAIGGKRGTSTNSERDQTINALLTELDGFSGTMGILTICATNRLDMLDEALIRPGRFDKQLAVPLPDKNGRFEILSKHARNKKFDKNVDFETIAKKTIGFSGADLEGLLNESALNAISSKRKTINNNDVEDAFFKILMKGNKKESIRTPEENKLVAYHEAGHALVTKLLTDDDVPSVTIIGSTSGAGGVTFRSPKETLLHSRKQLRNLIQISYAGRAAEFILLQDEDEITTGASSDIQAATRYIKSYIEHYGMGKHGMLALNEFKASAEDAFTEAAEMSKSLYHDTIKILQENQEILERIANKLIEKETIDGAELDELINPKEPEAVIVNFNKTTADGTSTSNLPI